ncbi:MAG TPA: exosome complex RNA-binding protein Rrp4 [Acidobacteriota bacterium]|nr:exosome complex RNA-binding protein Rrp4 [Acidobacteriota bacterium]
MSSELFVQEKDVTVPGELLAKGMDYLPGPGAFRKGDEIYANRVGLVSLNGRAIRLIPLCGPYMPKKDDVIICKVIDITLSGWRLDTHSAYPAMLNVRDATNSFVTKGADLTRILSIGDYICCQVFNVTTQKLIDVSLRGPGLRKLPVGQILTFSPNKFPRIIGRQGSMVSMIKHATNCQIVVGQNGWIWLSGEPAMEVIAVEAIRMIEEFAHISGLTDRMKSFLESKGLDTNVPAQPEQPAQEEGSMERSERPSFGGDRERSFDRPRRFDGGNRGGGRFDRPRGDRFERREKFSDRDRSDAPKQDADADQPQTAKKVEPTDDEPMVSEDSQSSDEE